MLGVLLEVRILFYFYGVRVDANETVRMVRTRVLERDASGARMMGAVGVRIRMEHLLQGARVVRSLFIENRCHLYSSVYIEMLCLQIRLALQCITITLKHEGLGFSSFIISL